MLTNFRNFSDEKVVINVPDTFHRSRENSSITADNSSLSSHVYSVDSIEMSNKNQGRNKTNKNSLRSEDNKLNENESRKKKRKALSKVITEYCNHSSIHGLNHFVERKRPFYEKIFWAMTFTLSLYCSCCLINNIWRKWQETPVIVSFSEKSTPVWQIPFPAITICAEMKAHKTRLPFSTLYGSLLAHLSENRTVIKGREGMSEEVFKRMRAAFQICDPYVTETINFPDTYEPIDLIPLIEEISPSFETTYPFCKWRDIIGTCERIIYRTITEEGICYTFNGLNSTELYREDTVNHGFLKDVFRQGILKWNLQSGYDADADIDAFPARVLGSGTRPGIFFALQGFEHNIDYICRGPIQGFKIQLHSPDEAPEISKQYIRVPFGKEILISVQPNMITTSESLSHYHPHRRQCYFSDERHLKYFKIYTQSNCHLECLANFTLMHCGCVKFSMPRSPETPVCDVAKISCYEEAEFKLLRNEFVEGYKESGENFRGETKCDCLPSCTSLNYDAEISQADFDLRRLIESFNETYHLENPGVMIARLAVFFKENQFITSKRSELYGLTDFLANCGGLLGLFIGASAISILEFIYYFPLRYLSNIFCVRNGNEIN